MARSPESMPLIGIDASRSTAARMTATERYSREVIAAMLRAGGHRFRLYAREPLPAPGAGTVCMATGTAVAGQYANIGTATGQPPVGAAVTATNPSHYYGTTPAITIITYTNGQDADLATGPFIPVGGVVTWTYQVTNTGNVTLTSVSVTDDRIASVTCPASVLPPGAGTVCTATGTAIVGQYSNLGTATGTPPGGPAVTATNRSHYFGTAPAIAISKLTNGFDANTLADPRPFLGLGSSVTWTYRVTNTRNVTLTGLAVIDDREGTISCPAAQLAQSASFTCTKVGVAATRGVYTNTGTVTGAPPGGALVTASDLSHYEVPYFNAVKTSAPGSGVQVRVGDRITYTIVLTSISSLPVYNIPITDAIPVGTTYVPGSAVPPANAGPDPLVWILPTVLPGIPYSVSFAVTVTGATETGSILNVGFVGNNPVTPTNEIVHSFIPTAIQLMSLRAERERETSGQEIVRVTWVVASEANTLGYRLFRSETPDRASASLVSNGVIAATGNGGIYAWIDEEVTATSRTTTGCRRSNWTARQSRSMARPRRTQGIPGRIAVSCPSCAGDAAPVATFGRTRAAQARRPRPARQNCCGRK